MCAFALDGVKNVTNERTNEPTDKAFLGVGSSDIVNKLDHRTHLKARFIQFATEQTIMLFVLSNTDSFLPFVQFEQLLGDHCWFLVYFMFQAKNN